MFYVGVWKDQHNNFSFRDEHLPYKLALLSASQNFTYRKVHLLDRIMFTNRKNIKCSMIASLELMIFGIADDIVTDLVEFQPTEFF